MGSKRYTTISVRIDVKRKLDAMRGDMDWSEFLIKLVEENARLRRIIAAREIQERFNAEIEKRVKESVRSMREMKLRGTL